MEFEVLLPRVALALGIGLLIGLERGWRTRAAESGSRTAGVRTFALSGLLGGISGAIAQAPSLAPGSIILSVGIAAYAPVITVFYREENRAAIADIDVHSKHSTCSVPLFLGFSAIDQASLAWDIFNRETVASDLVNRTSSRGPSQVRLGWHYARWGSRPLGPCRVPHPLAEAAAVPYGRGKAVKIPGRASDERATERRPTFCLVIIESIDIAKLERSNDLLGDRLAAI